ncbi:4Fe-4S ferredoxin [Oceanidesulfovibrio indonesiensis]|uniref:4Fe-4S ferredoxin n=1 Tax=Oceanidesulfovibrio indonesiensis TaxID=54767 RepID=A0A7M3MEW4_9BACT|nr:4Fe-4S dicluster domain-containing protein [Oceanidesulfovibrio indonesiensis]TVM17435.1 4Fe-4S ferredoxin [Oceanidesulfovibrio indonesiensis]
MSQYKIKFNRKRCIACEACLVHCKVKNKVPTGLSYNKLTVSDYEEKEGKPNLKLNYRACYHCPDPACVPACPTEAIHIREKDGIVWIDQEACIGCQQCIEACPWDVPVYDPDQNLTFKCDFCRDFVDQGMEPACVAGCTAKALSFVKK